MNGAAVFFHAVNHGNSSVALSLSNPAHAAALRDLIETQADLVLQDLKAGSLLKYDLGPEDLRAVKPFLVYCNLGAFGEVGSLRNKPGYNPPAQALSGLKSLVNHSDEPAASIRFRSTTWAWASGPRSASSRHSCGA